LVIFIVLIFNCDNIIKEGKLSWCFFNGQQEMEPDITYEYGVTVDCISSFI